MNIPPSYSRRINEQAARAKSYLDIIDELFPETQDEQDIIYYYISQFLTQCKYIARHLAKVYT